MDILTQLIALLSRRSARAAALTGCLGVVAVNGLAVANELEYQVKASYIYNFMQFIAWPNDAAAGGARFNLCVVGAERFGDALKSLAGAHTEGREIVVRALDRVGDANRERCQVLYVADGETDSADPIVSARGLLTIGETPGFLSRGGIINLVERNGHIRFEINHAAAQRAGLSVSSRILSLAINRS